MLNFENVRKITNQMKVESLAYAENFWQKIFDSREFDKDWRIFDEHEFSMGDFPHDADPNDFFEDMHFCVEYTCFGQLRVYFFPDSSTGDEYPKFRLLEEVLLKNGFVKVEANHLETGFVFVRSVI